MRRGFKAWCETASTKYRGALGLRQEQQLAPEDLADYLGVVVWRPEDIPGLPETALERLTVGDPSSWSAVTLQVGDSRLIIVNSAHALTRRRSSLAHELAHLILDHEPGRIDIAPKGQLLLSSFEFGREQEEEADWLAGSLLVPREGLFLKYQLIQDSRSLAAHFGVSVSMVNWRLRMTAVDKQAMRAQKRKQQR